MYAYALAPLHVETFKLTGFSFGGEVFVFIKLVYGLKGLPNFFTPRMFLFFKDLIRHDSALVYFDEIVFMSNCKPHKLQVFKQLYDIANEKI